MAESAPPQQQQQQQQEQQQHTYLPGHAASHITHHTWRTAENSSAYLLPTLQAMVQAKPTLQLLDCGAGPGTISASLAAYLPQGTVVATDVSAAVLERAAQSAAARGVANLRVVPASVYELPFPDAAFDVVHAQQLLCHLAAPRAALREMLRVCAGVVAVRECDLRVWSLHPDSPALRAFHALLLRGMEAAGGAPGLGARLVALALAAGVRRDRVAASCGTWCYATRAERAVFGGAMAERVRGGEMRAQALTLGLATAAEMDGMVRAWEVWIEAEDGWLGLMNGEIIITKE